MRRGVSSIFGGIFSSFGNWLFFGRWREGLKSSISRARVFEGKPQHQKFHGCWSGSWITGKILRKKFQSQIILKRFEETFRKREKVFQVSENTAKIRDEFSGCYKPSPLKKNLVPRFGD